MSKAVQPSKGRFVAKLVMTVLVVLGIVDEPTGIGVFDDPIVIALITGIINMIRHEATYRREHGRRPQYGGPQDRR